MANWTVKPVPGTAALDSANPANINITFRATNSVTSEVIDRIVPSGNWNTARAQSYAFNWIDELNARDAARAVSSAALSGIQTFISTAPTLATG
jgi:hypothetical protein